MAGAFLLLLMQQQTCISFSFPEEYISCLKVSVVVALCLEREGDDKVTPAGRMVPGLMRRAESRRDFLVPL